MNIIFTEFCNYIIEIVVLLQKFGNFLFENCILLDIFIELIAEILDFFSRFFEITSQFIHGILMLISKIENQVANSSSENKCKKNISSHLTNEKLKIKNEKYLPHNYSSLLHKINEKKSSFQIFPILL